MTSTPRQPVDPLMIGAAFVLGCLFLLAAGLYGYLTEDDPTPAATAAPSSTRPAAAQMMADLDANAYPVVAYQSLLNEWSAKCTQDQDTLAGYVYGGLQDLQKNGIRSETEYTLLRQFNLSTPDGRTDCKGIAAAYLVLREGR